MKNRLLIAVLAVAPVAAFASNIAVIDSGADYKHKDLIDQYLVNKDEVPDNKKDDDNNGKIDDVYGWDFAENSNQVIDYSYLDKLKPSMPDIHKFFEVQVRTLDGTATQEDKDWIKAKRDDDAFIKQLEIFGNFAHGTHVSGISEGYSTTLHKDSHPFMIKLIPTEVKLPFSTTYAQSPSFRALVDQANGSITIPTSVKEALFSLGLHYYAKLQATIFKQISQYTNVRKADVANCSFGSGFAQMRTIVEKLYNMVFKEGERDPKKVDSFTLEFLQQILINSRALVDGAPNTLFVFAAGNDGVDNTAFPSSPANIKADNTITVAATLRNRELASFSNYGTLVEVAAPGVGIASLYPGDDHGLMSGTSQAAPYVTSVAAEIKNQNPSLKPAEIKQIIMGTVDNKDWLVGKVTTSGIVNMERAFDAAKLTKTLSVDQAISMSRSRIKDQVTEVKPASTTSSFAQDDAFILPLPNPFN